MLIRKNYQLMICAPEPGDNSGAGGGDDAAAKAALAAKAAADKAAADKVIADKAAADKAAADAEAARLAAGGNKPTDEEAKLLKEVMQKKEALKAKEAEAEALKLQLKEFDGIDAAAVKQLLADKKAAETAELEKKGEWDRLKARIVEEHDKETKTLKDQLKAAADALEASRGTIGELSVGSQFSQSTFIKEELTLTASKARVVYGAHFDVVDGKVVPYDKPRGAASRTALVDGRGDNLEFDAALRKIVDADPDKEHLIKSKIKPGSGSGTDKPAKKTTEQTGAKSGVDSIAAGLGSLKIDLNAGKM